MENKCIYCGTTKDLSKSDIIPDALTNAKIINKNVCRVEHNNKFSDLFESEVIKKLSFITNELDIKSSKSKKYPTYCVEVNMKDTIFDIIFRTNISSEKELSNKVISSEDKKHILGPSDKLKNIKDSNVTKINNDEKNYEYYIKKPDYKVFFSLSMYRLVAKIAYEWYCAENNINDRLTVFEPIIKFITNGGENKIVSIVGNKDTYKLFSEFINFGSHVLISYIAKDNSINVLVSLFGIVIYNVKVCDSKINECNYSYLFQELMLNSKKIGTYKLNFNDTIGTLMDFHLNSNDREKMKYTLFCYDVCENNLKCITKEDDKTKNLIDNNIYNILQESALTPRSLKRFIIENKEVFSEDKKQINLNQRNMKELFIFYIIFITGQYYIESFEDLNKKIEEIFSIKEINVLEVCQKLYNEILSTKSYLDVIIRGANIINQWN